MNMQQVDLPRARTPASDDGVLRGTMHYKRPNNVAPHQPRWRLRPQSFPCGHSSPMYLLNFVMTCPPRCGSAHLFSR